ncbi:hypothetical protein [Amycolatopsis sp. NPDC052450]|uniref:hypothetical protein n=1 Tax=Amycolatopsis sp. NPDC052450 TaxID=3363937 RepID=UPI0037C4F835
MRTKGPPRDTPERSQISPREALAYPASAMAAIVASINRPIASSRRSGGVRRRG